MNNKGFMFVEAIVSTTILLVALVAIYVSYSAFIVGEKRRLYYDDMSYIYKTFTLKDVMYDDEIFFLDGTYTYYNSDALKKYADRYMERNNSHFYPISAGQTMFKPVIPGTPTISSEKFETFMNDYNVQKLIYIPKVSNLTDQDIIDIQQLTDNLYIRNYLKRLDIPCETDSACSHLYKGVIVSIIREHKNGANIEDGYNNFSQCMKNPNKKTMECQEADYLSWVYA